MNLAIDERKLTATAAATKTEVTISKWVNEGAPSWSDILTAHDVARLTRRHRWQLSAFAWIGRFPKPRRFRGRRLGWLRSEVVNWLTKDLTISGLPHSPSVQQHLPLNRVGRHFRSKRGRSRRAHLGQRLVRRPAAITQSHGGNQAGRS